MLQTVDRPPVIDYEDSGYKTDFWVGQGREYEDAVERLALARLMPPRGSRIAEIGAGFGRLADQYLGYEQIVLFDYSRTLLADAARTWGHDPRFVFVAGNIYELPLASGVLDTLVMVRVMHHLASVPEALAQLRRVLHQRSVAVIEYANKRNVKALARWLMRRQAWSPLELDPVEFVELNFDFHPAWMSQQFAAAGLTVAEQYGVSHFRLPVAKERIGAATLARLDAALFGLGGKYPLSPSVFVQATAPAAGVRAKSSTAPEDVVSLFRCPKSGSESLEQIDEGLVRSPKSGLTYARRDGVWDFKEPAG
jgi:SAM-dependent methyltransferase